MRSSGGMLILAVVGRAVLLAVPASAPDALTHPGPPNARYAPSLDRAWRAGVIVGYPDCTFKPDQILTRAELCEGFNRLLDVVRITQGIAFEDDLDPTYARGVRDHWGFHAWERLLNLKLVDHRPMQLVRDMDAGVWRLDFAELAVHTLRAYGLIPTDLTPVEIAIGDVMVRQADGKVHFCSPMPRWEFAVAMSNLLAKVSAAGG